jgi:hypothetical protein
VRGCCPGQRAHTCAGHLQQRGGGGAGHSAAERSMHDQPQQEGLSTTVCSMGHAQRKRSLPHWSAGHESVCHAQHVSQQRQ